MEKKEKSLDWVLLKRVLAMAKPYKGIFIACLALAVISAPLNALRPFLIQRMVDDYIYKLDMDGILKIAAIYMVVVLAIVIMRYFFIYTTALLGQSVIKDLRVKVFKHISRLNLSYFDRTPIGTATTRTINDVERINDVFAQGVITIIADLLSVVAVLSIMFYTSWRLTLICLLMMPFLVIATYVFKEKVKEAFGRVRTQISKMNAFLQERISGMRVIQIFNAEEQERKKFRGINRDYTQANLDSILYYAVFFPVVELISAIALSLLVWWGAGAYLDGMVSFGALVAFPIYLNMLFRPVRLLADKLNTLQMGLVASDRIFSVLDDESLISNEGSVSDKVIQGHVAFENVTFAYDGVNDVLKNINFQIEAGETLAVVGNTGSGKTTIINILNRFYQLKNGSVKIDQVDIRDYDLNFLRSKLSMVLQDVFLFAGSIVDNIRLRDESVTTEKIIACAKMIGAHEFIEKMPGGYDFVVTERGSNLSMGQRQLISFVRALVFDPEILILDEATSSIDTETEAIIQYAIEKLIEKRTSIIIAHRLSTIRNADKILVLRDGEIMELGSHDELLKIEDGIYRQMYEIQFQESAA